MTDKLDPVLSERLDRRASSPVPDPSGDGPEEPADERVDVVLGLRRAADDALLAVLAGHGLQVRSVLGDILTGSIALGAVAGLAASDDVVSIDSGGRLAAEGPEGATDGAPGA